MNKHSVRKFLAALSLVLGTGFVLTVVAQAQSAAPATPATPPVPAATASDQSSDQTVQLQKFVVTGSNLLQAGNEFVVPVTVLTPEQIATSGDETSTLDLLRKVEPSISGIGVENATIYTATTYGGSLINVHGLSVLVLVNGHRVASDAAEAVGGDRFTDLNMIPPAAIDRIEVLEDGGSAIYGSDAVGGVINIILKQDYNGWEATSHYGESNNNGHYNEKSFSVTGGVSNDRTSITLSASYGDSTPILFSQRPYTNPDYANDYIPGVIDIYSLATGVDEDYMLNPKYTAPPGGQQYTIDQLVAMGYYLDAGNDALPATEATLIPKIFNFATGQTLIESAKEANLTANVSHKIFGDSLQYFGDFLYSNSKTRSTLNAQPLYPYISDPYTDAWYNGGTPSPPEQYISYTTPSNPFSQAWMDQGATGAAGFGVDVHARFIQYPRIFADDSTAINFTNGFKGSIGSDYSWEVSNTISRYQIDYTNQNVINAANFFAALADGTLNPFATVQAPGVLPGNILGAASMNGLSTLSDVNFVFRGSPKEWTLPAGGVSFALGGYFSRETLSATADANTVDYGWLNSPSILPINKSREDVAYFGEVEVPIFGKGFQMPLGHSLSVDLAGRVEDYGGTVGSSKVPKVSLKYQPINDDFTIRATLGKSFVAPVMYELYGPTNEGSSNNITYTPYGTSSALGPLQFNAEGGSNPFLKPSTATTWTLGAEFDPSGIKGLSVSANYFSTHQLGLPGSVDQQTIVQSVEDLGSASPYASYVHFGGPNGPGPVSGGGQISGHPKSTVWLDVPTQNTGGTWTKGIDATAEYKFTTANAGKFDITSSAIIYTDVTYSDTVTDPYYSYLGDVSTTLGTEARYRLFNTFDWKFKGWQATINETFIPSVEDVGSGGANAIPGVHVGSYSQFDASVAYTFKDGDFGMANYLTGLTARVGMNNVFNEYPPVALNAENETKADVGFYDGAIGRMGYIDLTYKF